MAAPTPDREHAQKGLMYLARAGYAARGVVYILIGGLAFTAAIGAGGDTTGSRGALASLTDEPFGKALLGALALGLVGYSVWRFTQATLDADDHGTSAKGLAVRGGLFVSAITHLFLAFYALSLAAGWSFGGGGGGGSGGGSDDLAAWVLSQPFGRWLLGIAGLAVIGAGVAQLVKGFTAGFLKYVPTKQLRLPFATRACQFGLVARGVVFCIIGGLLIVAAVRVNPDDASGLGGALRTLRDNAWGPWLLGLIAVGLLAFAAYSLIEARYRVIHPGAGEGSATKLPSAVT